MNIIVTGASRGIGYELVKILSADPKNKIIAISRNLQKLEQLKKKCLSANPSSIVIPIACDLNDERSITNFASTLKQHVLSINIVINNAGAIANKPFMKISPADLQNIYNVNVFSVIRLIQLLLPIIDMKQKAHVVNIGSMGGFQGSSKFPGLSAYTSSKAALASLTECLAEEFKDKNIAFNCLALGSAQTEMLNEAFPGYKAPLSAGQMAEYIAHFSLSAHQYMNGKIIPVSLSTP
ncbi:MAG: SDR family NAD(P)-dependent oxidoreductase [Bacteroidota bacterium]